MKIKGWLFLVPLFLLMVGTAYADVKIIANKSVPTDTISKKELQEIFLGKRIKWADGTKVHFVLSDNPEVHETFVKNYLNRSTSQFKNYWRNQVFTGQGRMPKSFDSTQKLIDYVADTEGAIGYIDSGATAATVKTISVK